jgi:PKD repeat protein
VSITEEMCPEDLVADFIPHFTEGYSPVEVTFEDRSTGNPDSWYWDFGNGDTSTLQNPLPVTYTTVGEYDVSLKITRNNE